MEVHRELKEKEVIINKQMKEVEEKERLIEEL